jgi:hypothetical protein
MNDHVLCSRDAQRARDYSAQIHRLNHEPVQAERKLGWRRRAVAAAILGSAAYFVTSCVVELRLHKPKIDRANLRSGRNSTGK